MKWKLWLAAAFLAAVKLTGWLPFESHDVAELIPVQTLTVAVEENTVLLCADDCKGSGADWECALEDLRHGADGVLFLATAKQVVVARSALFLLPQVIRCRELRPAAVICVSMDEPPSPTVVTKYLSVHDAGVTIQQVRAAVLDRQGIRLPVLIETKRGLRLRGALDG